MAIVEIPTQPKPQRFSILLGDRNVQLSLRWRDSPEAGWTLDINELNGDGIIRGIPLVTGVNLLAQYQHIITGTLFVMSDVDAWATPTLDGLGSTGHLYYDDADPFAEDDNYGGRTLIDAWTFYGWLGFSDQVEYGAVTFAEEGYVGPVHHLVDLPKPTEQGAGNGG